ncbi:MAG: hypothetical protein AB1716_18405 [Planctomycetota bacterium]
MSLPPVPDSRPPSPPVPFDPAACATQVTTTQALIDNIPYIAMLALGAALLATTLPTPWPLPAAVAYVLYGLAGALWIMRFICPHCVFYATRLCPCGYGAIAARLAPRGPGDNFRRQFRRHIPVIVPLWLLPLVPAIPPLLRSFHSGLLIQVLLYAVNSFLVLPLVARWYGCARCPQKATCPWMGGCKG